MKINMTGMAYSFDSEGNTDKISISLSSYEMGESLNANVAITSDDLQENESLDDMTRKQVEEHAKQKCVKWFE